MEWSSFWKQFIDNKKLNSKIREMDTLSSLSIESVCHSIYDKYNVTELENVRGRLIQEIEKFPGVHLNTSRVKNIESVLRKVITKKYEWMMNPENRYSNLSEDNYDMIITDLVGIRFILSYRGDWHKLHAAIVDRFPYLEEEEYTDDRLIPLRDDKEFIAEIPRAYYAYGDDISIYDGERVKPILKKTGYRSVHYIVCFLGTYVEIQVRTIYDEAWSDCDHNYVYKHEENISHSALLDLSKVLCQYTNTCNDLTELMKSIYNKSDITEKNKKFYASEDTIKRIEALLDKFSIAQDQLIRFKNSVCVKGEEE